MSPVLFLLRSFLRDAAIGAWTASYDPVGNETCRAAPGSGATCAGSSSTGALSGYDNEERLFGWQNAPTTPTASTVYLYDGAGQRVQRVVTSGGTTTVTDYVSSLEEVTQSGGTTTTTAYYGGVAESVNGALSYLLSDGLGSVSLAVSASTAQTTAMQLYGPYGAVREQSGTLPTDKGYTGQVADATTSGLDYYGARYYDPVVGQFTSADTTLAGGLNRYAYVGGNPETKVDPTGHRRGPPGAYDPSLNYYGYPNNGPWTDQHRHDPDVLPGPVVQDNRINYKKAMLVLAWLNQTDGGKLSNDEISALAEWDDAWVLANYFQMAALIQSEGKSGTSADYQIGLQKPWIPSGGYAVWYPTTAEQYTPLTSDALSGAMQSTSLTAAQKAYNQSPFVVVDISYSPSLSKMTDAQMQQYANMILYPQPGHSRSSGAVRVILIRGDAVVLDDSKPNVPLFGPSEGTPPNLA